MLSHQPIGIAFGLRLSAHDVFSSKEASYLWNTSAQRVLNAVYSPYTPAVPPSGEASLPGSHCFFQMASQTAKEILIAFPAMIVLASEVQSKLVVSYESSPNN
jgi:hypothetical protein